MQIGFNFRINTYTQINTPMCEQSVQASQIDSVVSAKIVNVDKSTIQQILKLTNTMNIVQLAIIVLSEISHWFTDAASEG